MRRTASEDVTVNNNRAFRADSRLSACIRSLPLTVLHHLVHFRLNPPLVKTSAIFYKVISPTSF